MWTRAQEAAGLKVAQPRFTPTRLERAAVELMAAPQQRLIGCVTGSHPRQKVQKCLGVLSPGWRLQRVDRLGGPFGKGEIEQREVEQPFPRIIQNIEAHPLVAQPLSQPGLM